MRGKNLWIWLFLVIISIVFLFLRLKNLGNLSLWMDEGFYYLAADRVLEHGYPLLPSGSVLFKGILYSYVLAGVAFIFGLSEVSLRTVSVLCSVGLVPVMYLLAKKFAGRLLALVSILIILLSAWETEYARTVLYFIPLQLAYISGLYFFYRGYMEEEKKFKYLAAAALILTPQIHQLGMGLWFCFPALFLVKGAKRFFKKDVLISFSAVTLLYLLMQVHEVFFWKVGYVYVKPETSVQGFFKYFFTGFSLSYFKEILRSFPAMGLIAFFGLFLFLGELIARKEKSPEETKASQNWLFLNLSLFFPLLFLGFFRTHVHPRYLFQLLPILVLLFLVASWKIAQGASAILWEALGLRRGQKTVCRVLSVGFMALLLFTCVDQTGIGLSERIINREYKDRITTDIITRSGRFEHYDHRGPGRFVRHYLQKDDIVIAMHMVFQYIYAGRVDYWLWSGGPGTWDAWVLTPGGWKDVYVGARWVNNLADLEKIIDENGERRVWLITSPSILRQDHITSDIASFIKGNSDKLVFRGKDGMSEVYLWHEKEKILTAENHSLEGEWLPLSFGKPAFEPDASKGCSLFLERSKKKSRVARFSFGQSYPAGGYTLVIRAKTDVPQSPERLLGLILSPRKAKAQAPSRFLAGNDFTEKGVFQDFAFPVYLGQDEIPQVRVIFTGKANLWLDYLDLIPKRRSADDNNESP